MIHEVKACFIDCPLLQVTINNGNLCGHPETEGRSVGHGYETEPPDFCPLKKEDIIIKLKK